MIVLRNKIFTYPTNGRELKIKKEPRKIPVYYDDEDGNEVFGGYIDAPEDEDNMSLNELLGYFQKNING